MAMHDDKSWKAHGRRPSKETIVRACFMLLGHPPIIHAVDVLEGIRRDEAERASSEIAAGVISLCSCGDKNCR